jgi:hypothetical protein
MREAKQLELTVNDIRHNVGHFDLNEHMVLGNTDSAHEVIFGTMPILGEVAVKPFTREARAETESRNLMKAEKMGLETVEPLLVATGGLASYLVTRYKDDVTHLGMVDWHVDVANPDLHDVIDPTLATAAGTVAEWHTKGAAHGDLQVKNVTYTNTGRPIFLDAERATFHPAPDRFRLAADRDMQKLGKSALLRGLLYDKSASYRAGYLTDRLLIPYLDAVDPKKFDHSPEERQKVIADYWVYALQSRPIK